ncbi:MAG TPA: hypothetical protein VKJ47_17630 [Candidatus Binatia bacterium]|nr:hypothetical protein [Candidatus Binatia bacterium]
MRWLRHISPSAFLFLVFLFHCSQACLAAGHAHPAVTASVSTRHGSEHLPCHSSPAPPQGLPGKCPDCADHVYLPSVACGTETLAAAETFPVPFCFLTRPALPVLPQPHADASRPDLTVLSPPLYRTFSVLRL